MMRIENDNDWKNNWVVNLNNGTYDDLYPVFVGDSGSDSYYLKRRYKREGVLSNEIIFEIKRK